MTVDSREYLHPDDEKALAVLKAVPGFALLMRPYIKACEEPYKLIEMSNSIRVTPNQYAELYEMLPPICETLRIEEPELYLSLNRDPNAFTIGDHKPMIVVTSGLIESLDKSDVPAVLAHECGHIACHHCLYQTIGRSLFDQLHMLINVPFPVSVGIYLAMQHWMRCSELSADRAAAVYTGGPDHVIRLMMGFAGGCRNLNQQFSTEEYLRQAEQYQQEAKRSIWSRISNAYVLADQDHPFMATRALEIDRWCHSDQFQWILEAA